MADARQGHHTDGSNLSAIVPFKKRFLPAVRQRKSAPLHAKLAGAIGHEHCGPKGARLRTAEKLVLSVAKLGGACIDFIPRSSTGTFRNPWPGATMKIGVKGNFLYPIFRTSHRVLGQFEHRNFRTVLNALHARLDTRSSGEVAKQPETPFSQFSQQTLRPVGGQAERRPSATVPSQPAHS